MSTHTLTTSTIEDNKRLVRRAQRWLTRNPDCSPVDFVLTLDSHREAAGAVRVLGLRHDPLAREHVAILRRAQVSKGRCLTDDEIDRMIEALELIGARVDYRDAALLSIRKNRSVIRSLTVTRGSCLTPQTRRWHTISGLNGDDLLFPAFRLGVMQTGVQIGSNEIAARLHRSAILAQLDDPDSVNTRSLLPCEVTR